MWRAVLLLLLLPLAVPAAAAAVPGYRLLATPAGGLTAGARFRVVAP